eukprot:2889994-Lingulodinium_polyedra.AAC.1
MNEVERYVKTSLRDSRKERAVGLEELKKTLRKDLNTVVGIFRATEERMVKERSLLIGRVEKLERAPKHDAEHVSAKAASKSDLNQLQKENLELQSKLEDVNETVNSMAARLLDAEQRVATLQFEKESMLLNNADLE